MKSLLGLFFLSGLLLSSCGKVEVTPVKEDDDSKPSVFQPSESEVLSDLEVDKVKRICERSILATEKAKLNYVDSEKVFKFSSSFTGCDENKQSKDVELKLTQDGGLTFMPKGSVGLNFYFKEFINHDSAELKDFCGGQVEIYKRYLGDSSASPTQVTVYSGTDCSSNTKVICMKAVKAVANPPKEGETTTTYSVMKKEVYKFLVDADKKLDGFMLERVSTQYDGCGGVDNNIIKKTSKLESIE